MGNIFNLGDKEYVLSQYPKIDLSSLKALYVIKTN